MILLCLSTCWIAGIVAGLNFNLPAGLILTGLAPFPLLLIKKYRKQVMLAGFCIISFFTASVCAQNCLPDNNADYINFFNDSGTVTVTGIINDDPDVRDSNTRLLVKAEFIEINTEKLEVKGNILVFVSRYPEYSYGDRICITGELKTPPVFDDFDYASYLSHENIYSTVLYPQIELIAYEQGNAPLKWVYSLRTELSQSLAKVLPEPQAALAQAMLLGIRSNIPDDVKEAFSVTGTAHLLAISGLHTGIVAGIMLSIGLLLFGRRHYFYIWLALAVIWIYAVLTGLEAPVVRSAVMASIFLAAELTGRQRNAITALLLAAAVMTACDPQVIYSASFQMSFMAMCGLIFILPSLQNFTGRLTDGIPDRFPTLSKIAKFTCDSLAVTLAALAGVLPLTAYYFGIVSFAGAPATLLVLPILAGIIILGSLTAAAGLFLLPLAQVLGWLLWLILSYMLAVVEGFAALPIAYIETGSFSAIYLWIYYFALAILILAINKYKLLKRTDNEDGVDSLPNTLKSGVTKKAQQSIFLSRPFKLILTLILVTGILSSSAIRSVPDDNLHISFLDIGQGDAILIQKGNTQVLVDGGPGAQAVNLALSEKMPFWDRTIELVVLTHPHDDHLNGLVEVLKRYRVEHVLTTETGSYLPVYDEWQRFIDEKNISYTLARTGQQIDIDGVIIDVLNPQTTCFEGTGTDVDNNSIVLNIAFGEISFLLTGDMGKYAELELIKDRLITESTVLKVGHHGSRSSTSPEFMNVCRPQIAVISVGEDNEYGHPDTEVIERLIEMVGENNLYRTDRNGTLEFITDGSRLWLKVNRW